MINDKKKLRDDERAVSPVVGVILMVAITVIMAAIIGAFVYGYGGSMTHTASPAYTVTRTNATHVSITLADMGGASTITGVTKTAPLPVHILALLTASPGATDFTPAAAGEHLVVNATVDGTEKVVLNMRV